MDKNQIIKELYTLMDWVDDLHEKTETKNAGDLLETAVKSIDKAIRALEA